MFTFDRKYFILTAALFITEVLIALFVRDAFVRPYVGDYLVVMLIYCSIRTFLNASAGKVALFVLLFSYSIETLQYFRIVDRLGLQNNTVAKTVIGFGFDLMDLVAYTLGILTILILERSNVCQNKKGCLNAGSKHQ